MKKKYFIYFIESLILTLFTALVWITRTGENPDSIVDIRYIMTLLFISLLYNGIHEELTRFDYAKESIKSTIAEYCKVVVPIGVMFYMELIIIKIIMPFVPIGNFSLNIPLLYVFIAYILNVIHIFKYEDKDIKEQKNSKNKKWRFLRSLFIIIVTLLAMYIITYLLLVPLHIFYICLFVVVVSIKTIAIIKVWRKQEQTEA